ncbi:MAG: bestrophin-like domain [Bradyrhizobium sp.]
MISVWIFLVSFVAILAGGTLGMKLRARLPKGQLAAENREMIRLGAGLLATLVAVVISLAIASAKSSYDTQDAHFRQLAAYLVEADQLLAQYGPEAAGVRQRMREAVPAAIDRIWAEKAVARQDTAFTARSLAEQLYAAVEALSPNNDAQRFLKSRIVQAIADISRTRLLMFADGDTPALTPFLLILIFWLMVIFTSFGLFVEPGRIVFAALLVLALSISSALFLVADLSRPFAGLMQIPKEQLKQTLVPLS